MKCMGAIVTLTLFVSLQVICVQGWAIRHPDVVTVVSDDDEGNYSRGDIPQAELKQDISVEYSDHHRGDIPDYAMPDYYDSDDEEPEIDASTLSPDNPTTVALDTTTFQPIKPESKNIFDEESEGNTSTLPSVSESDYSTTVSSDTTTYQPIKPESENIFDELSESDEIFLNLTLESDENTGASLDKVPIH